MDQQTALNFLAEGALIIVLDMPVGTEFGMDYNSWNVGPKFRGVKMVPPGLHFIYYSSVGRTTNETGPRTGFFVFTEKQEVVVKRWNPSTEDLDDETQDVEQVARLRANILELDQYLAPYPFDDSLKRWLSLTGKIEPPVLQRLVPLNCKVCAASFSEQKEGESESAEQKFGFFKIDFRKYPEGMSAADMTKLGMDRSYWLEQMLQSVGNDYSQILGELQFAFVCFLIGHVYDAFEQWKKLIVLLCTCDDALDKHPDLFFEFIGVLHFHLKETPQDFFVDIVSRNNFLTATLKTFFSLILGDENHNAKLVDRTRNFKQMITKNFEWDFEDDDEDDLPVVVE
eukprot:m.313569 g.313569  ORF g.313569 m.313569 type:complete len:341 (+) comp16491_c4_seq1:88-1110(+)